MARPREFDIEDAVEKAMNVFWETGYDGTSLPALLEGIGISRGSLYKAFGSKHALFLRALDLYEKRYVDPGVARLNDDSIAGQERIASVFNGGITALSNGDRRGCLLCTSAAGAAHEDEAIAAKVQAQLDRLRDGFAVALAATETPPDTIPAQAAALTLNYVGLRVMVRGGGDAADLKAAVSRTVGELAA
ncbi:MAG: TetR/AcrR family transcriptional regulator [Pseudomonadota bacterium]